MVESTPNNYQTQQIMTASPAMLVVMLYDKAIISLRAAIRAIEDGEIETRWRNNNRAIEIISHLWSTLDMERGGEIAQNLSQLFAFMLNRLTQVDIRNDPKPAEEVIALLQPLHDSWKELAKNGGKETGQAATHKVDATTSTVVRGSDGDTPPPVTTGLSLSA